MLEKQIFLPRAIPENITLLFLECKRILFGKNKLLCEKDSYLEYFCKVWNVKNERIQSNDIDLVRNLL